MIPEIPISDREWHDRIARCTISCAATIEARKIKAHEAPLVIGALVKGLADHTGLPVDFILQMVSSAAKKDATPDSPPPLPPLPSATSIPS
jgi:hypothetical protein